MPSVFQLVACVAAAAACVFGTAEAGGKKRGPAVVVAQPVAVPVAPVVQVPMASKKGQGFNQPMGWGQGFNQPMGWGQGFNQPMGWGQGFNQPMGWGQTFGGQWGQPLVYANPRPYGAY